VDGSPRSARVRQTSRRTPRGARCSCELLVDLGGRDPTRALLADFGVAVSSLNLAIGPLHEVLAPEPADWHLRLAQRGATTSDLERLLAVVRSADTHGYQLLERVGVRCAAVRKRILERMRERPIPAAPPPVSERGARPERGPCRQSQQVASPAAVETGQDAPTSPSATAARPAPAEHFTAPAEATSAHPAPLASTTLHSIRASTLDELCGREADLRRLADAVTRRASRPILLIGPSGCGRTLLARHLAGVSSAPVFALDATGYTDDDDLRGDLAAIAGAGGIAIFDDLDRMPLDVAPAYLSALAHAWANGTPPVVAIVSPESRARLDGWLAGGTEGMDTIEIGPLTGADLEAAVAAASIPVLRDHGVELTAGVRIAELVRLCDRYLGGLAMPGRALDILDLACARTVREGARRLGRDTWLEIVAERSGLSRARIEAQADGSLLELEERLAARVVGHRETITTLSTLIRRNRAGFCGHRPIGSALLLGPSGVGKTEIAKALAEALFDRPDALVRLDMSEYTESHAVARVIGAPPGYVGHEQGGALTDPLRRRPHCVVLLDEIEKAHRDVHQLLLQVFDDGRLTDGRGRTVDFRHALIVMTSNLGADLIEGDVLDRDAVVASARAAFPVELYNRIEALEVLQPLSHDDKVRICQRLVRQSSEHLLSQRGIRYAVSEAAAAHLVQLAGRDPGLGARPLRHLLAREVEPLVADAVLRGRLRAGARADIDVRGGRFVLA
jgi:ATP-dependent Clp protease ATP-binding subunit ClpC